MRRIAATFAAASLLLTACGGEEAQVVDDAAAEVPLTSEQDLDAKPDFTIESDQAPPAELVVEDLVAGTGVEARAGDSVKMHYVGKAWSTGAEFDASWDRGQTFDFELGAGNVIQGWDQGIVGMQVGGRRKLTIPPALAYGPNGAGGVIGPNETLVFVVDLVAVSQTTMVDPLPTAADRPEFEVDNSGAPPTELVIEDLVVGDGEHEVTAGDKVVVHYIGRSWSTGEIFDESWQRGQTFDFVLGEGRVIAGWDQGVAGMKLGGRRMLTIPADLAYGERGAGSSIGPGETLVFVVDLVGYSTNS